MITRNRFIVALIALLALAPIHAQQEAVKKHPTTNEITEDLVIPSGRTLTLNGAIAGSPTSLANAASWRTLLGAASIGAANTFTAPQTFASSISVGSGITVGGNQLVFGTTTSYGLLNAPTQLFWMGVGGQASITSSGGRHGLIVRAPSGNGAAIVGWASSGAVAGKFYQDTAYTSPAVFVGRAATSASTPVVAIGAGTVTGTHSMIEVQGAGGAAVVTVRGDGAVSSLYQRFGSGAPTGVVSAPVGAIYHRTDGGAATSFYVKESGGTGNTGWVAK